MYLLYPPSPDLSAYIDCYWESCFHEAETGTYEELYVAQCNPNLIFNLTENYRHNDIQQNKSVAVTINTSAIQFQHNSTNKLFGIRFKAGSLRLFSAVGMHELTDNMIGISDIFGDKTQDFEHQIQCCQITAQRIAIAEEFLSKSIKHHHLEKFDLTLRLQNYLYQNCCAEDCISQLPQKMLITQRTADRYFQEFFGLSPKKMSRLLRFEHAFTALHHAHLDHKDPTTFGYYDAAHYSKEFKTFAGLTMQDYVTSPFFIQNLQSEHF